MYSFLFTSESPPSVEEGYWFHGYCFVGADYIFGNTGARAFEAARQVRIEAGEDGCYAVASREGDQYIFGADFAGYTKVWYFHSGDFWIVSNSLELVAAALRDSGKPVVPNLGQLARMTSKGNINNQQSSFESVIKNVYLLPIGCQLSVSRYCVEILPVVMAPHSVDYGVCLSTCCSLWVARFETLIRHEGMRLSPDLSGGLDSRVSFAFVERARRRLREAAKANISINSNVLSSDLEIAELVADALGLTLNARLSRTAISGATAIDAWSELSLGCYDLIYFPNVPFDAYYSTVTGGGGENNRAFYGKYLKDKTFDGLVVNATRGLQDERRREALGVEMKNAIETIKSISSSDVDELILFYRNFRARFHGGRRSQTQVNFTPLNSSSCDACSNAIGKDKLESGQLLYDLMYSLIPELIDIPFDSPGKAPGVEIRQMLAKADPGDQPQPGEIFAVSEIDTVIPPQTAPPLAILSSRFEAAKKSRLAGEFLGPEVIDDACAILERALQAGRFDSAIDGKSIAAVLTCAMFDAPETTGGARLASTGILVA